MGSLKKSFPDVEALLWRYTRVEMAVIYKLVPKDFVDEFANRFNRGHEEKPLSLIANAARWFEEVGKDDNWCGGMYQKGKSYEKILRDNLSLVETQIMPVLWFDIAEAAKEHVKRLKDSVPTRKMARNAASQLSSWGNDVDEREGMKLFIKEKAAHEKFLLNLIFKIENDPDCLREKIDHTLPSAENPSQSTPRI